MSYSILEFILYDSTQFKSNVELLTMRVQNLLGHRTQQVEWIANSSQISLPGPTPNLSGSKRIDLVLFPAFLGLPAYKYP